MPLEKSNPVRIAAYKAVLDLFTKATKLPINLFEYQEGKPRELITDTSKEYFEEHCKLIQSMDGGKLACDMDQCTRASNAFNEGTDHLSCCHAGLWNQTSPIKVNGEVKAILIYGEVLIDDAVHMEKSISHHRKAVQNLNLNETEAATLFDALMNSHKFPPGEFAEYRNLVTSIVSYLFTLMEEENKQKNTLEKTVHELNTRIQPIISLSENMMMSSSTLTARETKDMSNLMLNRAEALVTIINNLGDFRQAYIFEPQKIRPLLIEAWRIYTDESSDRNIKLRLNLQNLSTGEPVIPISRSQMQLAINNLVHNAIKYSFTGDQNLNRERFIKITGRAEKNYYAIEFSNYGVGIKEEEIKKGLIFLDGYQGELTYGENRTGSGKGLTYIKRVITRHGGKIKVESYPQGDRLESLFGKPHVNIFTIYLPYEIPNVEETHEL